jgi:hypothetical protein
MTQDRDRGEELVRRTNERYARTTAFGETLVGLGVDEARARVEAANEFELRTISPGQPVSLDYRPMRITLEVVDDRVVRTFAG